MRRVACLLYDDFQLLDLAGPVAAFEVAGLYGPSGYRIQMLAAETGLVATTTGARMWAQTLAEAEPFDILLVPGGYGVDHAGRNATLLAFIRRAEAEGRVIASVCTGSFVLAAAGVLAGRRATTHFHEAADLSARHPEIRVDPECLYVADGNIWSSAGVTAGIDLALALIERDYGRDVACRVAEALVMPFRRSGTQAQQSVALAFSGTESRFAEVLAWARGRLSEPLCVEQLADRAGLSPRQFSRAFKKTVGLSPAKAVERLRVETARAAIESGARSLDRVARDSGFADPERMRRAFLRTVGKPPRAWRSPSDASVG